MYGVDRQTDKPSRHAVKTCRLRVLSVERRGRERYGGRRRRRKGKWINERCQLGDSRVKRGQRSRAKGEGMSKNDKRKKDVRRNDVFVSYHASSRKRSSQVGLREKKQTAVNGCALSRRIGSALGLLQTQFKHANALGCFCRKGEAWRMSAL